jgi:putative addiction module antidote
MMKLELTAVGSAVGIVLPKEVLTRLGVGMGDYVVLTEAHDGYRLTPCDPEFEQMMAIGAKVMKKHHAALRELAK